MSQAPPPATPEAVLLTTRIINGALIVGVLFFLVVATVVGAAQRRPQGGPPPSPDEVAAKVAVPEADDPGAAVGLPPRPLTPGPITLVAGVAAFLAGGMSFLMPRIVADAGRRAISNQGKAEGAPDPLLATYQTQLIVGLALLEGAAFLGAIAYFIEGSYFGLGIALVLVALMAARFPTRDGLDSWLRTQRELLQAEGGLAS